MHTLPHWTEACILWNYHPQAHYRVQKSRWVRRQQHQGVKSETLFNKVYLKHSKFLKIT